MERYAPTIKDLAPRDIVSRSMALEVLEGRGVGPKKDHVLLKIDHIGAENIMEKLPGIHELALVFAGVDATKEPIPVMPTAHYQNGGIPTNYHTKVIKGNMDGEEFVPGFFAAGECASASVHGANRLGTNSLLDLVVFGRTAGEQAAKYAAENTLVPLSEDAGNEGLAALQKYSNANGKHTFGELWGGELTDVMQKKMSVFRTEQLMTECYAELLEIEAKMDDYKINDKSSVYNLDLIEALELNNMILVAKACTQAALLRKESRGGHFRDDCPDRDDANFLKHTEVYLEEDLKTPRVDYRKVRQQPLTVDAFPPNLGFTKGGRM